MNSKVDLKFWIGIAVSIFFMVLLFEKIDYQSLAGALGKADYRYVFLAVCFIFISYFLRAVRWRYLLIAEKFLSLSSLYSATIIGYMANNILPARIGEFVRAYTLAQKEHLETPAVFASLVVDRLCDGFTVIILLLITLSTLQMPVGMHDSTLALKVGGTLMFIIYCCAMLFLYLLKRHTVRMLSGIGYVLRPFPSRVAENIIPLLGSFIGGIKMSSRSGHIAALIATSFGIWLCCLLSVNMVLRSFNVDLPMTVSMFILILLVFAVMVPASPGFIGTYHYACFKGLTVLGIPETTSVSIALIMHATDFFPVIIAGLYYLWKNSLSLNELKRARKAI